MRNRSAHNLSKDLGENRSAANVNNIAHIAATFDLNQTPQRRAPKPAIDIRSDRAAKIEEHPRSSHTIAACRSTDCSLI
jgi:hypothetical protein